MKILLRIPTVQYGYMDVEFEGTPEEAIEEHNRIIRLYNGGFGLDKKEWNKLLDTYLKGEGMDSNLMEKLDERQSWWIHEFDKASARINK